MTGLSEHMRTVRVAHIFVSEFIPQKVTHLTCTPHAAGVNGRENAHTARYARSWSERSVSCKGKYGPEPWGDNYDVRPSTSQHQGHSLLLGCCTCRWPQRRGVPPKYPRQKKTRWVTAAQPSSFCSGSNVWAVFYGQTGIKSRQPP